MPYYRPKPEVLVNKDTEGRKKTQIHKSREQLIDRKDLTMPVLRYPNPLDKAYTFKKKPSLNTIWYYHSASRHQVYAHLAQGSGYTHKSGERSNLDRSMLKPVLYPIGQKYDRTHLIPFGYHGSESDPRLVIGWNAFQNRNEMSDFEQKQKKLKQDIYWLTDVRRTKYGAALRYEIFSARDDRLLDSLVVKVGSAQAPVKFYWKEKMDN